MTHAPRIHDVVDILASEYGTPRHGNPRGVLEDLVFLMLSNRSTSALASRIYRQLRRGHTWAELAATPISDICNLLRPLGLQKKRASQLRRLLISVSTEHGAYSLESLRRCSERVAFASLIKLPGVSTKVAKCVQLYTLGARVLPVDVHVFRISKRLGFLKASRPALSHRAMEAVVPEALRHSYHVTCISHGRAICRAIPDCEHCVLESRCPRLGT